MHPLYYKEVAKYARRPIGNHGVPCVFCCVKSGIDNAGRTHAIMFISSKDLSLRRNIALEVPCSL